MPCTVARQSNLRDNETIVSRKEFDGKVKKYQDGKRQVLMIRPVNT